MNNSFCFQIVCHSHIITLHFECSFFLKKTYIYQKRKLTDVINATFFLNFHEADFFFIEFISGIHTSYSKAVKATVKNNQKILFC